MVWSAREPGALRQANTADTRRKDRWKRSNRQRISPLGSPGSKSGAETPCRGRRWQNPRRDTWSESPVAHRRPALAPNRGQQNEEQSQETLVGCLVLMTSEDDSFQDQSVRSQFLPVLSTVRPTAAPTLATARALARDPGPFPSRNRCFPRYDRVAPWSGEG